MDELEIGIEHMPMPFGKHQGRALKSVPKDYLYWVAHNVEIKECHKYVDEYIELYYEEIEDAYKEEQRLKSLGY